MKVRSFKWRAGAGAKKRRGNAFITFKGEKGRLPRRIAIGAAAALIFIALAFALRPEPVLMNSAEVATVWDNGALRVGVMSGVPKLATEDGGLERELAELLAERIMEADSDWTGENIPIQFVEVNSMTVAGKMKDGSIDVAIAMMPRGGTSAYSYSRAYYTDGIWFVVRPGMEDIAIRNVKIGYLQSASSSNLYVPSGIVSSRLTTYIENHPDDGLDELKKGFASYDDLLSALNAGEIDCALLTGTMINKYREEYGFSVSRTQFGVVGYSVAAPGAESALATIADMMLGEMQEDGSLAALLQKYGLENAEELPAEE